MGRGVFCATQKTPSSLQDFSSDTPFRSVEVRQSYHGALQFSVPSNEQMMRSLWSHVLVLGLICVEAAAASPPSGAALDPSDPVAGRSHWAFQPLRERRPGVVMPNSNSWSRSSIDDFILPRLQSEKLKPAVDAAPRDLIR